MIAFMKLVKHAKTTSRPLFPTFEPLESADLKILSLKTVLLFAPTTVKQVSDINTLSVAPECLRFSNDGRLGLQENWRPSIHLLLRLRMTGGFIVSVRSIGGRRRQGGVLLNFLSPDCR